MCIKRYNLFDLIWVSRKFFISGASWILRKYIQGSFRFELDHIHDNIDSVYLYYRFQRVEYAPLYARELRGAPQGQVWWLVSRILRRRDAEVSEFLPVRG